MRILVWSAKYTPPRPLDEIEVDLKQIEKGLQGMLSEVTE